MAELSESLENSIDEILDNSSVYVNKRAVKLALFSMGDFDESPEKIFTLSQLYNFYNTSRVVPKLVSEYLEKKDIKFSELFDDVESATYILRISEVIRIHREELFNRALVDAIENDLIKP